jgi:hypothetical protein
MNASSLLADLRSRGVRLWLTPDGPRLDPVSLLRQEDLAAMKTMRNELLELLKAEEAGKVQTLIETPRETSTMFWADLLGGKRALLIIEDEDDLIPDLRDVRFFEPEQHFQICDTGIRPANEAPPVPEDPPAGAHFYLCRHDGRECVPGEECFMWTWQGAKQWFYAATDPPPVQVPPKRTKAKETETNETNDSFDPSTEGDS